MDDQRRVMSVEKTKRHKSSTLQLSKYAPIGQPVIYYCVHSKENHTPTHGHIFFTLLEEAGAVDRQKGSKLRVNV